MVDLSGPKSETCTETGTGTHRQNRRAFVAEFVDGGGETHGRSERTRTNEIDTPHKTLFVTPFHSFRNQPGRMEFWM